MADAGGEPLAVDVAVVGGGLIGAAAALGLARSGRRVALVEPRGAPGIDRGALGIEIRTVAVSPASRTLLESMDAFGGVPAAPYRHMEVWEERGTRAMTFHAADAGRDELGWIVESGVLTAALWRVLERRDEVELIRGRFDGFAADDRGLTLSLRPAGDPPDDTSGPVPATALRTRLLVAADGARSAVRQRLGVTVREFDVGQTALATVVRTAQPHGAVAYQRFLLDGPLALLPAEDERVSSVVWSQRPEEAARRCALDDDAFAAELGRALQHRLGAVEAVDRRLAFPLAQQLAESFNPHPRVLLLGDAARVVHPLAGLGANLGLEDVAAMLEVLENAGDATDPGGGGLWRAFDRQRGARARLMVGMLGGLRHLYARGDPLSQWLRNLGVGWLDAALPLKRQIMIEAMGLGPVAGAPR